MRALLVSCVALVVGCKGIEDYDQPPDVAPPATTPNNLPPPDCTQYDWQGNVYDCSVLDRCNEQDFSYRLACCDCDPALCNPDPTCEDAPEPPDVDPLGGESCMACHNGSDQDDYFGTGISNPHPFGAAAYTKCTTCHGGLDGNGKADSHVPPPPQIGDENQLVVDQYSYFNYLTRVGLDYMPDYTDQYGNTWTGLDYLQFMNPGDLRVVQAGRGCGTSGCHDTEHAAWVPTSPLGMDRFFSTTMYSIGAENQVAANVGLYSDTAADYAFRRLDDPSWVYNAAEVGRVGTLYEVPVRAVYGDTTGIYNNPIYDSNALANYVYAAAEAPEKTNSVKTGQPLHYLIQQAIDLACMDCHTGSSGANNRYADFRSSGCSACHMEYSMDGRSRSTDPNVPKLEPANPDAIAAPERAHISDHQIRNVAKVLPGGAFVRGQNDKVCVGCHQGSNRTVLQYWGIRLDQNQDVVNNFMYPANPNTFVNTADDERLYDPAVANNTFNGRNANQYLLFEDYDADNRDDTPADLHYEAGLGCIDCHGSRDLHNGTEGDPTSGQLMSHQTQSVGIQCVSCHGDASGTANTTTCTTYDGAAAECAVDRLGNAVRNVTRDPATGDFWLISRIDGLRHFIPQTYETIVNTNHAHPLTGNLMYNPLASYAMGRADGSASTGQGPLQTNPYLYDLGFSHMDSVSCEGCHASWTNSCIGCHMTGIYDANPQNYFFSNITGERVSYNFAADFTYISPILFNLGVSARDEITASQPGMKMFFKYFDLNNNESAVFAMSDRNGNGNNPNYLGRGEFPALQHNRIYPHSIRSNVEADAEGSRMCVACHLNTDQIDNFGADYAVFMADIDNRNYANLDYNLLQQHIGQNTGNQLNSPYYVHMAAGLGTGLFQFDATGCPNNPLDANANRFYCPNGAPADNFDPNNTVYDLDKMVEYTGVSNVSISHPMLEGGYSAYRQGSLDPALAGPLGVNILYKLADPNQGVVLDSWIDANGNAQGDAANYIQ
jgi:hypothetical protein